MTKINILHLTFDMCLGGTEQVIRQIVENIDRTQFSQRVTCLDGKIGELGELIEKNGIPVNFFTRLPSLDIKLILQLRKYIKEHHIHIVHCHQYTPYIYGLAASLFSSCRVIFTEHGRFYPDSYKWKRVVLNPILSLFTQKITAISKATGEALKVYEKIPAYKINVIYNGIRFEHKALPDEKTRLNYKNELNIEPNKIVFGTISRLDPIKNQSMMIEAFADIQKEVTDTILLIIGDGPCRLELESLVASLGLQQKVVFTGFIINPQRYLSIMDVFLLPSLSEGTSMTLLESMAYKKPSIVTDVGGNPEIVIDSVTGLITPNEDKQALSLALTTLATSKPLRDKLGEAALLRYQKQFTERHMVEAYQNLYKDIA